MVDISTVGAILTSVKTATEIAKMLKDSDLSLEKAEIKLKLADLVVSLADAKMEAADIQELILAKDSRIRELEEAQALHLKMEWREPVYYQKNESGEESSFCPQCYDSERKAIRLQIWDQSHWHCMTCKNDFFGKNHASPSPEIAPDYDPYS